MITIYQCKKDKSVVVLSSLHEEAKIEKGPSNPKKKPNLVLAYNATKCGVDSVDQMTRFYSVKYPSRRWPVQVWSNVLNLAAINSWILYREVNNISKKKLTRYSFIEKFVREIRDLVQSPPSSPVQNRVSSIEITPTLAFQDSRRRITFNSAPTPPTTSSFSSSASSKSRTSCQVKKCVRNRAVDTCSKCKILTCGKCVSIKLTYLLKL